MASAALTVEEQKAVDDFRRDVVTPSMDKLVILDFWAEWCGPCKQLTPVLEKVAADYADKGVVLAKLDVEANKFIASQFQVRSIPTVYAMYQGQPIADLTPARTEQQLKQMLDQLLEKLPLGEADNGEDAAPDLAPLIEEGERLLGVSDGEQAYAAFATALQHDPQSAGAISGLIRALTELGRSEEANAMLASLPDDIQSDPAIERACAVLAIAADRRDPSELEAMRDKVAADPADHQARLELASALMAAGERDEAADALLHIIEADRDWNEGAARDKLLALFDTIGLEDPWVAATRRRLSAVLFG